MLGRLQMHELAHSVRVTDVSITLITNKLVAIRISSFIQKRLQKAPGTPMLQIFASFFSCQQSESLLFEENAIFSLGTINSFLCATLNSLLFSPVESSFPVCYNVQNPLENCCVQQSDVPL